MASTTNYLTGLGPAPLYVYDNHVAGPQNTLAAFRLFRWFGSPPKVGYCTAGVAPDGVTCHDWTWNPPGGGSAVYFPPTTGYLAVRGQPVKVRTGGTFAAGANLQSDGSGKVITHASGPVVLRALEASTATDQVVWAVFL